MRSRGRARVGGVVLLVAGLTACAPDLPASVVPGTEITVGWAGELTSLNAAASPTPGNLDIAGATRSGFGDVVDGAFVADTGFGTVEIVGDVPFTVRYDLAEPAWSDGIPLDAADLLLGWAAATGQLAPEEEDADEDDEVPVVSSFDEFGRAIEVAFPTPTSGWRSAVQASVPAHVVGERAFDLDDPMQAKQAVIRAIQEEDEAALEVIGDVWTDAFDVTDESEIAADLRLSSGAYRVDRVAIEAGGQSVSLVPNPAYTGAAAPEVARIDLVPAGDDPVSAVGNSLDVVQVAPTTQNRGLVRDLERRDNPVLTSHDGSVWTVLLRPAGVFAQPGARAAFLRAVPARDLLDRGGGGWASAYATTTSVLAAPDSAAYDIVSEDSGFASALGTPSQDAALDRERAGVPAGAPVCVLHDRASEFAVGALEALGDAVGEAGWNLVDCGADDVDAALGQPGWDAAIVRVPLPETPAQIAAQWGSGSDASLVGSADADRDALIAQLAQTADVYDERDLLARIESSIVRAAVARPLAMNARVTISTREVTGVAVRDGATASLTRGLADWATQRTD